MVFILGWTGWTLWAAALGLCLAFHAGCDGLQGRLSGQKRRVGRDGVAKGSRSEWMPYLALHAGWHAAAVALALGSPLLGLAEGAAHAGIDWLICEGKIGAVADQALHVACKVAWIAALRAMG